MKCKLLYLLLLLPMVSKAQLIDGPLGRAESNSLIADSIAASTPPANAVPNELDNDANYIALKASSGGLFVGKMSYLLETSLDEIQAYLIENGWQYQGEKTISASQKNITYSLPSDDGNERICVLIFFTEIDKKMPAILKFVTTDLRWSRYAVKELKELEYKYKSITNRADASTMLYYRWGGDTFVVTSIAGNKQTLSGNLIMMEASIDPIKRYTDYGGKLEDLPSYKSAKPKSSHKIASK